MMEITNILAYRISELIFNKIITEFQLLIE